MLRLVPSRTIALVAGAVLAVSGESCAGRGMGPQRNVYGNPADEEIAERCTIPGTGSTIRLYHGGGGATVASWSTVTEQTRGGPERQFWFSYSRPTVFEIECRPGTLELTLGDTTDRRAVTFTAAQIRGELVPRPVIVWRGEQRERIARETYGAPSFAALQAGFGFPMMFAGLIVAAWGAAGVRRRG